MNLPKAMPDPLPILRRGLTCDEARRAVEYGLARGLLSIRTDAKAISHPKLYQPEVRRDRVPRDLSPDLRKLAKP